MNHVTHLLSSAVIRIFLPKISNFCYIKKFRYWLHFDIQFLVLLTFFESLRIKVFWKKVMTLGSILESKDMHVISFRKRAKKCLKRAKKSKIFENFGKNLQKGPGLINSVHKITNKILSCDSNYIVDVTMWSKFCKIEKLFMIMIIRIWPKKLTSSRGDLDSSSKIWGMDFKFYTSVTSQKLLGANINVCRRGKKLVGGPFWPLHPE